MSSDGFRIYPNPNDGLFTVELVDENISRCDFHLQVFNALGQAVYVEAFIANTETMNTELPPGLYYASAKDKDGHMYLQKFIVQR